MAERDQGGEDFLDLVLISADEAAAAAVNLAAPRKKKGPPISAVPRIVAGATAPVVRQL